MAPIANISLLDAVLLLSTPPTPTVRLEGATEAIICWDYKEVLPWLPGSGLKEGRCQWEWGLQLPAAESELWSYIKEAEGTGLPQWQDIWLLAQSYYCSVGIQFVQIWVHNPSFSACEMRIKTWLHCWEAMGDWLWTALKKCCALALKHCCSFSSISCSSSEETDFEN